MQNSLILFLSIFGVAITFYISIAHILKKKIICPISSKSCNIVLDSRYSKTFGIKNEIIGLTYYIIILLSLYVTIPSLFIKATSSIAAVYSIILFGIQVKKLKNYCSWCICTAIINILLFIIIIKI